MKHYAIHNKINQIRIIPFFLVFLSTFCNWALADDYNLKLQTPAADEDKSGIEWSDDAQTQTPPIQIDHTTEKASYFVKIQGKYTKKNANLLYNNQRIEPDPKGNFTISVDISSPSEKFDVLVINEAGDVYKEKGTLLFPDWDKFVQSQTQKPTKKYGIYPNIGFTYLSYSQTAVPTITEIAVTPKVDATYAVTERWSADANVFGNVLLLSDSPSSQSIQMFGFNVKGGYTLKKFINDQWSLKISGGYYYTTSFSNSNAFGFSDVNGIELFPVVTHFFPKDQKAWLYLKYSPIFNGLALLSLNNTEMGIGGGFSFTPFKNGHFVSATLDVVLLQLTLVGISAQTTSVTLGGSYNF